MAEPREDGYWRGDIYHDDQGYWHRTEDESLQGPYETEMTARTQMRHYIQELEEGPQRLDDYN